MTSARTSVAVVLLALGLVAVSGVVSGQTGYGGNYVQQAENETATRSPATSGTEQIDTNTRLVSATLTDDMTARITVESDVPQTIVIVDSAGVFSRGEVNSRRVSVLPDKRTTLTLPVTETSDGFVGVSLTVQSGTIYGVPLERGGDDFSAPQQSDLLALFAGVGSVLLLIWGIEWWVTRRDEQGVTRIDG